MKKVRQFNFFVKINFAWGDQSETIGVRAYVLDGMGGSGGEIVE